MRKVIIVIGHGQLPSDLPKEVRERYFRLRANPRKKPDERRRYEELDRTIANGPRNDLNDPSWSSPRKLADLVKLREKYDVVVAYTVKREYARIFQFKPRKYLMLGVEEETCLMGTAATRGAFCGTAMYNWERFGHSSEARGLG